MPIYGWIAIAGGAIVLLLSMMPGRKGSWFQGAGLLAASAGDYLLGFNSSENLGYCLGIAAFGLAFILYALHSLTHGSLNRKTAWLTSSILGIFLLVFPWGQALLTVSGALRMAGGLYFLLTCICTGIVAGRRPFTVGAACCLAACLLLALSDCFLIGCHFLHLTWCDLLCLPIYKFSLLAATCGGLLDIFSPQRKFSIM